MLLAYALITNSPPQTVYALLSAIWTPGGLLELLLTVMIGYR
jgi:hypothetical protein